MYKVLLGFMLGISVSIAIDDIEKNDRLGLQRAEREAKAAAKERLLERQKHYRHQFEQERRGVFNPPVDKEA